MPGHASTVHDCDEKCIGDLPFFMGRGRWWFLGGHPKIFELKGGAIPKFLSLKGGPSQKLKPEEVFYG